jgi:glycosyltransferase involved in cell wall biosynthesis
MNEIGGLRSIWDNIPRELFSRIIVVDAKSTDGTLEFLADRKCEVLQQSKPGRGNAIREAMLQIGEDVIALMASDGNDDPRYIPALLAKIAEGYEVVSGSRFVEGGKTDDSDDPLGIRRLGNRFFTYLVNILWKAHYTDSTYGMRAFTGNAWSKLGMNASRNETEFLMSIRSVKLGLKVCQIPIVEGRRTGGEVKARSLSTGLSFIRIILRELLQS